MSKKSIALHRKYHGKLEVRGKVPLRNKHDLGVAYTPGVAAVCRAISKAPKEVRELTIKRNTIAIVSDGSAILGLGNLGPEAAIPVMEGKAILLKQFGGVDAFPICLATQDPDEIVATIERIAPVFGGINLEDISAPRCFDIESRLRRLLNIPVFHDDQHGTATVVLAALVNALAVRNTSPKEARVVISGAGAAGTATARLLKSYGVRHISVADRHGVLYTTRPHMTKWKQDLARAIGAHRAPRGGVRLADLLKGADVFIGVSAPGLVTAEMIRTMNPRPIIFALANPVPEIMPNEAKRGGAFIVGTGRSDLPNQINNVLAFPGIFRGALDHGVRLVTDKMLIAAAKGIAACVRQPSPGSIIPSVFDPKVVRAVSQAIATK
jgi:malate dehydrogenase (oxaloacetate-decarboxylating)